MVLDKLTNAIECVTNTPQLEGFKSYVWIKL